MDILFVSRFVFFIACGFYAAWHVRKAQLTGVWPTWWKIHRDKEPLAYWTLMTMGSLMTLIAIASVVALLVDQFMG